MSTTFMLYVEIQTGSIDRAEELREGVLLLLDEQFQEHELVESPATKPIDWLPWLMLVLDHVH